ncbi:nitrate reductase molybdenum cofactor assembly chaperone [Kocuria coralli]|uniref:Nitrate reductase molybdenum cofactor assembly chaperone n=1 Tax=Kocuria coralli TaxID=1461025 RepID=A0A5J5KY23_9MICC|nr:nitrate reductase molybdenum cofactor assembly chaperone [Kocuria coralli]KAA9394200.1 nitrate reductase molybdenum cofactor assembly chaperone [Kocuria coralli]
MSRLARLFGLAGKGTVDTGSWEDTTPRRSAVIRQSAALLLGYPDDELIRRLPSIREALVEVGADTGAIGPLVSWLTERPLAEVQGDYVQEFDLSRRHPLHLTYWTDGDTRRRGEALLAFKQMYRENGRELDDSELPDHLPVVLEFAALINPEDGAQLLQRYRPSLELLRLALRDDALPQLGVIELVCSTLPGPSPEDRDAVMKMAGYGPPVETVGLQPFDPRLLPVVDGPRTQEPATALSSAPHPRGAVASPSTRGSA